MKKISTLLMLFCAFVCSAWAQTPIKFADFDATKYYRIYSTTRDGGPHAIAPNADASKGAMAVYNTNDLNQIWQIIPATGENEGKYLLFNVRTQKYLCNVGGDTGANMNADVANANIGYYEIRLKAGREELVGFCHSGGDNPRHWLYNEAPALNGWNGNGHEYFYLEEATIPTAIPVAKLSDLSNDKVYVFKSGRSDATTSHYLLYHTDAPNNLSSTYGSGHAMEFSESKPNFQFAIYNYEGKYYFYNIAAGKFVGNADVNNAAIPLVETITNAIEIRSSSNATYNFALSTNGTGALNVAATIGCHGVVNWTGGYSDLTDGGNIYQILEVGELSSADKNKLDTEVEKQMVIAEVNSIVFSTLGQNVVGAWTTDAKSALAAPLDQYINHATDADADTYFQNLKAELDYWVSHPEEAKVQLLPGEKFAVKCVDTNRGYMVYSTVEGKGSETQAYLAGTNCADFHAAVGDDGIYKEWAIASYEGKNYIYNVQKKQFINSDGVVQFTETPVALRLIDINNGLWEIQFENNNKYLSFSPGWGANCVRTEPGIDNGCKFYLEKVGGSVTEEEILSVVEKTFVDTWRNRVFQTINYIGGFPDSQTDAINAVNTLAKTVAYDETAERVAMAPGYYFIKKVNNSKYVTVDGINMMATATAEGINQIWKFEQIDGGYSLKHANLDAFVALEDADANSGSATKVNSAEGATFTLEHKGNAQQLLKSNGKPMRTEGGGAVNYWWGDVNTTWYLIPATDLEVDITAAGWATLHLPFDVVLPETGLKAYAVSDVKMNGTEGSATLVEKTSIPANEGAILEGAQDTYTLKIAQAEAWTGNKLEGTNVNAYIAGPAYVLGIPEGESEVMFAKAVLNKNEAGETGSTHFLNNANKAYLPASAVTSLAATLRFNFGGTTAIESVLNNGVDANAPIYDLSGRRVNNAVKGGIYIQNGKKFIVK